ncbi:hypothetical protein GQX73_g7175 [Xylaria multiplex]|uniref:Protein kinase domain-containing protein n=1 Tax=Xylaria multiplex TaxID=323545 RepID=A0A7C8N214_9PEZI|nr:hypothetical protein GQX73_g7175 [Xylaria multiplex]
MAWLKLQSNQPQRPSANHTQKTTQLGEDHIQPDDEPTQTNTESTQLNTEPTQPHEKPTPSIEELLQPHVPSHLGARLENQPAITLDWNRAAGVYISPYGGNKPLDHWVKVAMEDCEPARVLIVAPNAEQIGCTVVHNDTMCHFFFNPANDNIVFDNVSSRPFFATRLGAETDWKVQANNTFDLCVGVWSLVTRGRPLMEVQVLKRTQWSNTSCLSAKRAATMDEKSVKRVRLSDSRTAVQTRLTGPAGNPRTVSSENALAQLEKGMTIRIGSHENGYWLKHLGTIYENRNTVVWRAQHSEFPNGDIAVKIIKAYGDDGKRVIDAAKRWQREMTLHSSLPSHVSPKQLQHSGSTLGLDTNFLKQSTIVPLVNFDARFHSLYTEYIDSKPLLAHTHPDSSFNGSITDAYKIMRDMAAALSVAHAQQVVHGDIKLANVLYSSTRGAVTIDFGLSFLSDDPPRYGGTPWYLPPEYAEGWNLRQPASDIWALGIVMLWVLGRICMPEKNSKSWQIADIHPEGPRTIAQENAVNSMKEWIRFIQKVRSGLQRDNGLEGIIFKTLQTNVRDRIDAASLCERISRLRITSSKDDTSDNRY